MDSKVSGLFWGDSELEDAPYSIKLTALWLITNPRITLYGYTEVTEKRFMFETDLPVEALAATLEALPKSFLRASKGVWARNFIRYQFKDWERIERNHIGKAIANKLLASNDAELISLVLAEYPSLQALCKPLPSPIHPLTKGKEQSKSKSREEQGSAEGALPTQGGLAKLEPQPSRTREAGEAQFLERVSRIFGAKKNRGPSYLEQQALAGMREFPTEEELAVVEAFYRVPQDDQGNPRRPESRESLIANWGKIVDRAETCRREKGLSVVPKKNAAPEPWPAGAREWFAAEYPKATAPVDWGDVDERVRDRFQRRAA